MGNVRFVRQNNNAGRKLPTSSQTFPRITNGNAFYSGAPALVQDASFPMSNALLPDRSASIWVNPAGLTNFNGADTILEIDLGSLKTIYAHGIFGVLAFTPGAFPSSYFFEYLPGTTTYSTVGWIQTPVTSFATRRDAGVVLASPVSARYVRFKIVAVIQGNGFSLASLVVAQGITDLGFLYARASETIVQPKTVIEGYGRLPTITRTGVPFRRWELQYPNNDRATRDIFDGLMSETVSFTYIDPDDRFWECVVDGEEFMREHIWAPPDRFAFSFLMRSLP